MQQCTIHEKSVQWLRSNEYLSNEKPRFQPKFVEYFAVDTASSSRPESERKKRKEERRNRPIVVTSNSAAQGFPKKKKSKKKNDKEKGHQKRSSSDPGIIQNAPPQCKGFF